MLGVGLIWALVCGWELTLGGFAIAPVFRNHDDYANKLVAWVSGAELGGL